MARAPISADHGPDIVQGGQQFRPGSGSKPGEWVTDITRLGGQSGGKPGWKPSIQHAHVIEAEKPQQPPKPGGRARNRVSSSSTPTRVTSSAFEGRSGQSALIGRNQHAPQDARTSHADGLALFDRWRGARTLLRPGPGSA